MALAPTRMEYRLALSHPASGKTLDEPVIVARHPSETMEHVTLRVLAYCLFHEERLEFGPGLSDPDAPDLSARDLTGRLTSWIECGALSSEKARKVVQQNHGLLLHALFDDARRAAELAAELAGWKRRDGARIWTLDPKLVAALAASDERKRRWTVTVLEDHLYLDAPGGTVESPLSSVTIAA